MNYLKMIEDLLILYAFVTYWAYSEALIDSLKIKLHEYINHAYGLTERIVVLGAIILLYLQSTKINYFLYFSTAAFFNIFFRLSLNKERGKKYDYISNSNNYDRIFLFISKKHGGKIAYIFELIITILGLYLYLK